MCYNYFNGVGGISFDAPLPLLYESAKKLTSTSRSYQLLIDAPADHLSTLVHLRGWLCIQYVYVALLRNFTEINFTK